MSHFAQDDAVGVGVGEETEELGESHEGGPQERRGECHDFVWQYHRRDFIFSSY